MFSNNVCLPLICWRKQKGIVWVVKKYKSRRIKWRNALKNELHFLSSSSTTAANILNDAKNNKLNIQNYPKIFLYRVKWLNGGHFSNHDIRMLFDANFACDLTYKNPFSFNIQWEFVVLVHKTLRSISKSIQRVTAPPRLADLTVLIELATYSTNNEISLSLRIRVSPR